jgi:hypothetical protein
MERFLFPEKQGSIDVTAVVEPMGNDILVCLKGGKAHVGAVGIGQPRPSFKNPKNTSSTASVFALLGHKEDALAKEMAESLSRALNCTVVVVAGMHWDELQEVDIRKVAAVCHALERKIVQVVTEEKRKQGLGPE